MNEDTEGWETIELPVIFADSTFNYKFHGEIHSGGIFIDNLRLYKEDLSSLIQTEIPHEGIDMREHIYNLNGKLMGGGNVYSSLPPGLYIIRRGETVRKFLKR